jgi:kinesin family protein C1
MDGRAQTREGELSFIDLAGSENLKQSRAGEDGLSSTKKETQSINLSLTTLQTVIMALQSKNQHVPYRESKLTMLLQVRRVLALYPHPCMATAALVLPRDEHALTRSRLCTPGFRLQNSLSNSAKTLMICNLSPLGGQLKETVNTLQFASRVGSCKTTGSGSKA